MTLWAAATSALPATIGFNRNMPYQNGHFYSPVISPDEVRGDAHLIWPAIPTVDGVNFNDESHVRLLRDVFPKFMGDYNYPEQLVESANLEQFFNGNSQFGGLDSRLLFVLLRELRPKKVIEVGSGFSSLLMADVNSRYLNMGSDIVCVEPYPRAFLKNRIKGITGLIEKRAQDVDLSVFDALNDGDVLFIDSSHVSKTGSDVNYLFLRVLPRIRKGVYIHIHDIFFPQDYPKTWVLDDQRSWNEQYLLQALLMYSSGFEVIFGSNYAYASHNQLVAKAVPHPSGHAVSGGSFWIRKTA